MTQSRRERHGQTVRREANAASRQHAGVHPYTRELLELRELLDELPEAVELVEADLEADAGMLLSEMTVNELLRVGMLMQLNDLTYERLAYRLADSEGCRMFFRLGPVPKPEALRKNLNLVRLETWKKLEELVIRAGQVRGMSFRGAKYRRWK
jgi:hypothetical protein